MVYWLSLPATAPGPKPFYLPWARTWCTSTCMRTSKAYHTCTVSSAQAVKRCACGSTCSMISSMLCWQAQNSIRSISLIPPKAPPAPPNLSSSQINNNALKSMTSRTKYSRITSSSALRTSCIPKLMSISTESLGRRQGNRSSSTALLMERLDLRLTPASLAALAAGT